MGTLTVPASRREEPTRPARRWARLWARTGRAAGRTAAGLMASAVVAAAALACGAAAAASASADTAAAGTTAADATATADPADGREARIVEMSLALEHDALLPGHEAAIGVVFSIRDHWHMYWPGQNETGFPAEFRFTLPEGYTVGEPAWPAPRRYVAPGDILDHVHEGTLVVLFPLRVPASAQPGETVELRLEADWLVCAEACVPESASAVVRAGVVGEASAQRPGPGEGLIREARTSLPAAWSPAQRDVQVTWSGDGVSLRPAVPAARLEFYPAADSLPVRGLLASGASETGVLNLVVDRAAATSASGGPIAEGGVPALRGVLMSQESAGSKPRYTHVVLPLPAAEGTP